MNPAGDAHAETTLQTAGTTRGTPRLEREVVAALVFGEALAVYDFTIHAFSAKRSREAVLLSRSAGDIHPARRRGDTGPT